MLRNKRTSRKQVETILKQLSSEDCVYKLISHEHLGNNAHTYSYTYSICIYDKYNKYQASVSKNLTLKATYDYVLRLLAVKNKTDIAITSKTSKKGCILNVQFV